MVCPYRVNRFWLWLVFVTMVCIHTARITASLCLVTVPGSLWRAALTRPIVNILIFTRVMFLLHSCLLVSFWYGVLSALYYLISVECNWIPFYLSAVLSLVDLLIALSTSSKMVEPLYILCKLSTWLHLSGIVLEWSVKLVECRLQQSLAEEQKSQIWANYDARWQAGTETSWGGRRRWWRYDRVWPNEISSDELTNCTTQEICKTVLLVSLYECRVNSDRIVLCLF